MSHLESGSVVWVRLGQAWWPGTITTDAKCPPEYVEGIRKMPLAIVKFFHENKYQDVHKSEHICPYNNERKEEFIRRGQCINRNQSQGEVDLLAKFEADVVTAEKLTGGDMNILHTLGEVAGKRRIDYSDLGFGPPKPKKKKEEGTKRGSDIGQAVVYKMVGSRSIGNKLQRVVIQHKVRILEQPKRENAEEDMRAASNWYKCYSCGYTCSRLNVIIWHNKAHIKKVYNYDTGIKIPGRRKRKQGTPKANKNIKKKGKDAKGKENLDHAHTNGDVSGSKRDLQDTQQLLMDWDDDDDDVIDGDRTTTLPAGLDKAERQNESDDGYSDVDDYPPPQPKYERRPMPKASDINSAFDALLAATPANPVTPSSSQTSNYINNDSDSDYSDWEKYYSRGSGSGSEDEEVEQESDIKSLCEGEEGKAERTAGTNSQNSQEDKENDAECTQKEKHIVEIGSEDHTENTPSPKIGNVADGKSQFHNYNYRQEELTPEPEEDEVKQSSLNTHYEPAENMDEPIEDTSELIEENNMPSHIIPEYVEVTDDPCQDGERSPDRSYGESDKPVEVNYEPVEDSHDLREGIFEPRSDTHNPVKDIYESVQCFDEPNEDVQSSTDDDDKLGAYNDAPTEEDSGAPSDYIENLHEYADEPDHNTDEPSTSHLGGDTLESSDDMGQLTHESSDDMGQLTHESADEMGQLTHESSDDMRRLTQESADDIGQLTHESAENMEQLTHESADDVEQLTHESADDTGQLTHEPADDVEQLTHESADDMGQLTHESSENMEQLTHESAHEIEQLTHESNAYHESNENIEQLTCESNDDMEHQSRESNYDMEHQSHEPNDDMEHQSHEPNNDMEHQSHEPNDEMEQLTRESNNEMELLTHESNDEMEQLTHESNENIEQLTSESNEDMEQLTDEPNEDMEQQTHESTDDNEQLTQNIDKLNKNIDEFTQNLNMRLAESAAVVDDAPEILRLKERRYDPIKETCETALDETCSSPEPSHSKREGELEDSSEPVKTSDAATASSSGTTYMLVAVDAHGNTVPTVPTPALSEGGNDLVAVEATMEDGTTRTLYIDPSQLGPNVDLNNLMLHIDSSGQEHVIIPSSSSSDSETPSQELSSTDTRGLHHNIPETSSTQVPYPVETRGYHDQMNYIEASRGDEYSPAQPEEGDSS